MTKIDKKSTENRSIIDLASEGLEGFEVIGYYNYLQSFGEIPKEKFDQLFELIFIEKGIQQYEVEDIQFEIQGNEGMIIQPGEIHSTNNQPEQKGSAYWMIFSSNPKKISKGLNISYNEANEIINIFRNNYDRIFHFNEETKKYLKLIFSTKEVNPIIKTLKIKTFLINIFLEIFRSIRYRNEQRQYSLPVMKSLDFIRSHIREKITLDRIAGVSGISVSYLKYLFKKETGLTPMHYVNREKIKLSSTLLSDSDAKITDVAFELDFSTSQYFATVFKKYTGISPKEWQKNTLLYKSNDDQVT